MKNLKELSEKYSKYSNGLGHIRWGGKGYYKVNSEEEIQLNRDSSGFILNKRNQVQCYEFFDAPFLYYLDGVKIDEDHYHELLEEIGYDWEREEELKLEVVHDNTRKWWDETLDNYFPYPWYPDKKIVAIEIMNDIPFTSTGMKHEVFGFEDDWKGIIRIATGCGYHDYSVDDCLEYPEFFKPIYEND